MIEVISSGRTLRFKGETSAEHRLWSDSLHKLCNPPKPQEEDKEIMIPTSNRREIDRERIADPKKSRDYAEEVKGSDKKQDYEKQANGEEEKTKDEEYTRRKSLDDSPYCREETRQIEISRRHSENIESIKNENRRIQAKETDNSDSDESDSDEELIPRESKQPSRGTDQRRTSLVDSIKSFNPCAEPKVTKPITTNVEYDEPQDDSSRVSSPSLAPRQNECEEVKEEYTKHETIRPDNNFAEDDWDADEIAPQPSRTSPFKVCIESKDINIY